MPASATATPATSKPVKSTPKPCNSATVEKKPGQDASNPSTSNGSKTSSHRQKAASLRIAKALAMFDSFDRSYHSTYRQNILDIQHSLVERIDNLVNSLAALSPGNSNPSSVDDTARLEQRREVNKTLNAHLVCLQSASCAARDIAAQQADVVFEEIQKHRPQEVKVKRGKTSKKERKEKEVASSSKAERSSHREKAATSKSHAHTTNHVDPVPETPLSTNNRVANKRRATQTPTSAPPAEKKSKKENGVKKRTSNRLSKTPRVKAKEEDEPTYCFCSRISFGEMIGCDNDKCEIEWFHFECIGLTTKPKGKWFCPNCRHPDSARMPKTNRAVNANNKSSTAVEKV
ncbi:PHD-finger [Oesophagostomum dentatum]|uniref:PHD-finger n=1 Tax=Oesophagostomum dentatum TaxID=61180 RepID=A0A0B1TFB5_OESDE|nr:PHD-finger [Oesophagostomum dentatum]